MPDMPRQRLQMLKAFLVCSLAAVPAYAQSGPPATPEIVARAVAGTPVPERGPVEATWESIAVNYQVPIWWRDAKFGIMMHWGLYAVPAHGSEWYALHMYNNPEMAQWHREHWGSQDVFGYKDFIPLFTAAKFDPDQWAALFKDAGAQFVIPTAEHHDGFALWNSTTNVYNAAVMGPRRDLIADLGAAVRKQGLKFGVSDHSIEHFTFIQEAAAPSNDLRDPAWAAFYAVRDRQNPGAVEHFLSSWLTKQYELIDKYQPDILWYDNGVNSRVLDPIKLRVAQHYYNRALEWKKEVSISSKGHGADAAFLAGTLTDYERMGRAPTGLTDFVWQVDEPVLYRFGYTENNPSPIARAGGVIANLVNNVSRNGGLLLNISPRADGTIPDDQQSLLRAIGAWLTINGEAMYFTRPWTTWGEGAAKLERGQAWSANDIRFTTRGDTLYALFMAWPSGEAVIRSLASGAPVKGDVNRVTLLGDNRALAYSRDSLGLHIAFPPQHATDPVYALRITGLKLRLNTAR
jgi:alpha-L-fucosidase